MTLFSFWGGDKKTSSDTDPTSDSYRKDKVNEDYKGIYYEKDNKRRK